MKVKVKTVKNEVFFMEVEAAQTVRACVVNEATA
jgi:hypothetical protein